MPTQSSITHTLAKFRHTLTVSTTSLPHHDLKRAEVIPIFKKDIKKDSKNLKENYRPVSILSNISKISETCLYKELSSYFEDIF